MVLVHPPRLRFHLLPSPFPTCTNGIRNPTNPRTSCAPPINTDKYAQLLKLFNIIEDYLTLIVEVLFIKDSKAPLSVIQKSYSRMVLMVHPDQGRIDPNK